MKQMSMGIQPDNTSKFQYPEELARKGLKPQHEMADQSGNIMKQPKWNRAWIIVDKVRSYRTKEDFLFVEDIKMV